MKVEVKAHEGSDTWEVATLPHGKTAIGAQWIYKTKYNANGTIERHKGRQVGMGNRQVHRKDFDETFAPVVKMCIVRSLLGLVAAKGWEIHQMDVHNAFLHGDFDEESYDILGNQGYMNGKSNSYELWCLLFFSCFLKKKRILVT